MLKAQYVVTDIPPFSLKNLERVLDTEVQPHCPTEEAAQGLCPAETEVSCLLRASGKEPKRE